MVGEPPAPHDVQATFCATLVDEWIRLGIRHAVVAPGSRSTPLAIAIAARPEIALHVAHDERVAAFIALGIASPGASRADACAPALLVCTSGTAAANFFPAVVEAGLSEIPLLVLTADRPEELRGVGAPQTIDQIELYGGHVRWFHDPGVPSVDGRDGWRDLARQAWSRSITGPVHLNLPFREPLLGTAGVLPDAEDAPPPVIRLTAKGDPVPEAFDQQRGVILVGGLHGQDHAEIDALHETTGWPILADPASGHRGRPGVVSHADALLRHDGFARDHAADVVVRVGRPPSSKVVNTWAARDDVLMVQVGGPGRINPEHSVSAFCRLDDLLATSPRGATGTTWLTRWTTADTRAGEAIATTLDEFDTLTEPGAAREVAHWCAERHADLTVASSMPVRDLEWFGGPRAVGHANRGANGIDGTLSTAVGRALAGDGPAVVLVGDLAFVHDSNALVALAARSVGLRIVVIDNDGGGIFSFLPQASALDEQRFETLFGTPLGTDVLGIAAAHGLPVHEATTPTELRRALDVPGSPVIRVPSDRRWNVDVHRRIFEAVSDTLGRPPAEGSANLQHKPATGV